MSEKLPGNGVSSLLPVPHPRTVPRSAADAQIRDFIAQMVDKHELSSSEIMATLASIASSYAMAIRRRCDAEGSR